MIGNERTVDSDYIRDIVKDARQRNLNIVDVLEARGLLLTSDKRQELLVEHACAVAALIMLVTPQQMGIKLPCTPKQVQEGIAQYIENFFNKR